MWGILQQQQPAPNEPTGDTSIPESHHDLLPLTHPPSPITALTPSAAITAHPHSLLATCISVAFAFSCPQGFAGHTLQLWIPFLTSSSCNLNTGPCDQYFNGSMLTPEHPSLVASDQWCLSPIRVNRYMVTVFSHIWIFPPPFSPISVLEIFCRVKQISGFLI